MAKLATFIVVHLIAVAARGVHPVRAQRSAARTLDLETVEHVNLPAVVASSPTTTEIIFNVPSEEEAAAPGPDTVDYYDDKTPIIGPL